jgi:hypothetical protein
MSPGIDPFMIELDKEFTTIIAIDSGSSIAELPTQIVKAIKELESVPSRKSARKTFGGKKTRSKKSKKSRSKKSKKTTSRK